MSGYTLTNVFLYAVVNTFTPGPGNILALNTVTNYGRKKGRRLFFDIFAGYYEVLFMKGFLLQFVNIKIYLFGITAFTGFIVPYSTRLTVLICFELLIATIWTIAAMTWIGMDFLIQTFYLKYYRILNIILVLTLGECIWSMLK